ncbi:hypothetical protein [Aneurinibacillus sp. REN35]
MIVCRIVLGEISYRGTLYTAIREVYEDGIWKLVLVNDNERIVLLVH